MFSCLSNGKIIKVFGKLLNQYDFCDAVLKKFTEFQAEFIPEEYYIRKEDLQNSGIFHPSYWADSYEQFDVQKCETNYFKIYVESYWRKIQYLKKENGNQKYKYLPNMVLTILLPHGNAGPERRFSMNKTLVEKHGKNIDQDTLESIRIMKDCIINKGGYLNVEITKEMISKCKSSCSLVTKNILTTNEKKKKSSKSKEILRYLPRFPYVLIS